MQTITVNVDNKKLAEKVTWMLNHFKDDGLEIISAEDWDDLQAIEATRFDETISLEEYLKNEA